MIEAILDARKVQEFIWGKISICDLNMSQWAGMFSKRVNKICEIDQKSPMWKVELRKRVLQQAALSIKMLAILDEEISIEPDIKL